MAEDPRDLPRAQDQGLTCRRVTHLFNAEHDMKTSSYSAFSSQHSTAHVIQSLAVNGSRSRRSRVVLKGLITCMIVAAAHAIQHMGLSSPHVWRSQDCFAEDATVSRALFSLTHAKESVNVVDVYIEAAENSLPLRLDAR